MASVTQCDVCGNVAKHNETMYLQIHRNTDGNELGGVIVKRDICKECMNKIMRILKLEEVR